MPSFMQKAQNLKSRKRHNTAGNNPQLPPFVNKLIKNMNKYYDSMEKIQFSDFLFNASKNTLVMSILLPLELILNLIIVYKIRCK